jgi:alpha-mannosidase
MLKKAEAGDEYSLRVYEMDGKEAQTADISFASDIESACEADGTEKRIGDASFNGNKLHVQITPFGVRTYKVMLKKKEPVQIASMSMPLTYDKKCFSFNAMRSEANFESGYSYAAELLPDSIMTVDDIAFHFGEKDAANGMACKGNVLQLPKNNTFNRLYILVASTTGDCKATFQAGKNQTTFLVPNYTGFIGQWEHVGQNKGFLKDAEVAYVGTHRHSPSGDGAYEFTYMFKYGIDIPKGATEVTLPNDPRIVVFAATLVSEDQPAVVPAAPFYRTSLKTNNASEATAQKNNLLKQATIAGCSGYVNEKEAPALVLDGNEKTKWCDTTPNPNYLDFDLGSAKSVSGWKIVCAGAEDRSFVTRTCFLMGRNAVTEEWKTLDEIDNNHSTVVEHGFNPAQVRYLRLLVTNPTQETGNTPTRICELEVY